MNMSLNQMLLKKMVLSIVLGAAAVLATLEVHASVVISGTRVVYPAGESEVTVNMTNRGDVPALVQSWLDNGQDVDKSPDQIEVPFTLLPPMFRIEPDGRQSLRMIYTGDSLPQDRESLFWLNVLDVPQKAQDSGESNQLQFAFRSRIKVFFRPNDLPYVAEEAPAELQWRLVASDEGHALEVRNPTPYYISFDSVGLVAAGQRHAREADSSSEGSMVNPGESNRFALPSLTVAPGSEAEVEFETIDDYGARRLHTATLSL